MIKQFTGIFDSFSILMEDIKTKINQIQDSNKEYSYYFSFLHKEDIPASEKQYIFGEIENIITNKMGQSPVMSVIQFLFLKKAEAKVAYNFTLEVEPYSCKDIASDTKAYANVIGYA